MSGRNQFQVAECFDGALLWLGRLVRLWHMLAYVCLDLFHINDQTDLFFLFVGAGKLAGKSQAANGSDVTNFDAAPVYLLDYHHSIIAAE